MVGKHAIGGNRPECERHARRGRRWLVGLCRWALALVLRGRWRGIDQSEIDPGVVAGGEGGMGSAAPLRA
jgi:hypothetical protein